MLVAKTPESTVLHFVREKMRRSHFRNFRGQRLADAEMPGTPGYAFAERDQSRSNAGDGFFIRMRGGNFVQVDAARQIEANRWRRGDLGMKRDDGHVRKDTRKTKSAFRGRHFLLQNILLIYSMMEVLSRKFRPCRGMANTSKCS